MPEPEFAELAQAFATVWRGLGERQQLATLADVLKDVFFDPVKETITLPLYPDAAQKVIRT